MIATERACPSEAELHDLAGGYLPTDRFSSLLDHVESCSECQSRVEGAAAGDSLIAALAQRAEPDPLLAEPDCLAALHHAAALHPASPGDAGIPERSTPPVESLGVYRLIRPLGQGAMGAVYLAEHTRLRRRCAVKLLPRDRGFDAQWRERFEREMAAVAGINHPHVVAATDAGESAGWHYLVMEYLDGLDLGSLSLRMPRLDVREACEVARQAAVGLAEIHAAGLVHRDIKPSNLMLTRDGVVKILDLGLVMAGADPLPNMDRLTTVGHLMGTLAYMAPEQLVDSQTVDQRADLYALGATLYRLLTGTSPHAADRGLAPLVIAKTGKDVPPIAQTRPDLPVELARLVDRLLSRDPAARGESAEEIAGLLAPLAAGADLKRLARRALRKGTSDEERSTTFSVLPLGSAKSIPPRPPRGRGRWIAAAAGLPLSALLGIVIWVQTDRGQLVVESETADVAVRVQQGGELVEELRLETGENRVTLRSGTYTVSIDAEADGIRLSGQTATITRGGEAILRVRQDPSVSIASADEAAAGSLFRGKPLEYWLVILETEHDVELVIDAMTAAVELTKELGAEDQVKERIAKGILRAAKRFGTWWSVGGMGGGFGDNHAPVPASEQFMLHMPALYQTLLPSPGVGALIEELEAGNQRSSLASLSILAAYVNRQVVNYGNPEFGQLELWTASEEGQERLRRMAKAIDTAAERFGGYQAELPTEVRSESGFYTYNAVATAYQVRLKLAAWLNEDPFQIPHLGERLAKSLEEKAGWNRQAFADLAPLLVAGGEQGYQPALLEEEIVAAGSFAAAETLLWAGLPGAWHSSFRGASNEDIVPTMTLLVEQLPEDAADATLVGIESYLATADFNYYPKIPALPSLWVQCVRNLATHTSTPELAHYWLSNLQLNLSAKQTGTKNVSAELLGAIETSLARLAERQATESPDSGSEE